MKLALLIAAVDARISGVMIFGDRGTGKSTAARALAATLPPMSVVEGCRFNCAPEAREECPDLCTSLKAHKMPVPFVDLPLGSTEDRVLGTLDLERALAHGEKRFEPGLLAKAHRWAPVRAKQVTSYPRSAKALTVARPMVPVAPKTKIRFGAPEVSG